MMNPPAKSPIPRNVLSVFVGFIAGCFINMSLIQIGPNVIPPPEGVDMSDMESLKEAMMQMKPIHFVFPFLAHALGTLAGAFVATKVAASHKMKFAIVIGVFFLLGGITMVALVGGPTWFILLDLIGAYLPMSILGGILAGAKKTEAAPS